MKGWSTFFTLLGVLTIIGAVFGFLFNPILSIGLVITALSFCFCSSLCGRITEILENQKKILIMVDNLRD